MNAEGIDRLDVLQSLLCAPLRLTGMKHEVFAAGRHTVDEVIVTHRFLIILAGGVDYRIEGRRHRLTAGTQFFVPAWCRREWTAARRLGGCELVWCEFSSDPVMVPPLMCWREVGCVKEEAAAFERMRETIAAPGRAEMLRKEGELKACLARFWINAHVERAGDERAGEMHPEVARTKAWLERHYAESDALERFYGTLALSPNHFRLLYKRHTGETVQETLARLRLRRARYLVQETNRPLKQIALETGFADPLYFSACYRRFWGRPASVERRTRGAA